MLDDSEVRRVVHAIIDRLDRSELRVATPPKIDDNNSDTWRDPDAVVCQHRRYVPRRGVNSDAA